MRGLRVWSTVLLLAACESPVNPELSIEAIDPSGDNAARGIIEGTFVVDVRQGDVSICADGCSTDVRGGDFDLALPIQSFEEPTRIRARLMGGPSELEGAVPRFAVAGEFLETNQLSIRIAMMPAGECQPLELFNVSTAGRPRLVEGRRDLAVGVRRNLVVLAGGVSVDGASNRVDFFDQVVVEMRPPLSSPPGPLGRSRGLTLSEDATLVVGDTSWVYDRQVQGPPAAVPVSLHGGASFASALARLGTTGAVIGGRDTDQVSWLTARTVVATTRLSVPRQFAAAGTGEDGVLVVGGASGAEWISPTSDGVPVESDAIPESSGGWVVASPSRQTFLAIGGSGTRTTVFRGCPSCTVEAGPEWARSREGASGLRTAAGDFWILGGGGSALIDRVEWNGETPTIVEGPQLVHGRDGAAVAEHASGMVFVVGGEGPRGMRDDVELCSPPEGLDPLM